MNKQSEIIRLKDLGFTERAIARTLKTSRRTVHKYLADERDLLSTPPDELFSWDLVIQDHQTNGVPLLVLWDELKEKENEKIKWSYSYFWKLYQNRAPSTCPVTMICHHPAGEKAEIDRHTTPL